MEFLLSDIPFDTTTKYHVTKAFERVLHGPDLFDSTDETKWFKGRPPNFRIVLNKRTSGGIGHNGTGKLIVHSEDFGKSCQRWFRTDGNCVQVDGSDTKIRISFGRTRKYDPTLAKTIYVGPEKQESHDKVLSQLYKYGNLRVSAVQFGTLDRQPMPPFANRAFAFDHEQRFNDGSKKAWLGIHYEHKEIQIYVGNSQTELKKDTIIIKWSSIRSMSMGNDSGNAYIVFNLITSAIFVRGGFDGHSQTRRIPWLNDTHEQVAPYARHLRLTLQDSDDPFQFMDMCTIAGVEPLPVYYTPVSPGWLDSYNTQLATSEQLTRRLEKIEKWLTRMNWDTAFQVELLMRNGLLSTTEVWVNLRSHIDNLCAEHGSDASEILRQFSVELITGAASGSKTSPKDLLDMICGRMKDERMRLRKMDLPDSYFMCHHITITPTRMLLEGPYPTQNNRVIRGYQEYDSTLVGNFVRVDFRDEDRFQYRFNRAVDGGYLLEKRVLDFLKPGFSLGGRHFDFFAYSSSSLRDSHALWAIHPFDVPVGASPTILCGHITADMIRHSLGNFSTVINQPSKLAARVGQTCSATTPSVRLKREQWDDDMVDLGESPYEHTDGVGTISSDLRDEIWATLCSKGWDKDKDRAKPDAFQIRFLGFKGVVVVDYCLTGIRMRLRPSMKKFDVDEEEKNNASFEIVRAFDRPNRYSLNRSTIMVLEDRGVPIDTFMKLQEKAKETIFTAGDSIASFVAFLRINRLGIGFDLPLILERLAVLKDSSHKNVVRSFENPFLERVLRFAMNSRLRDLKHKAQIPVPGGFKLVGVADEGQAYIQEGLDPSSVATLKEGEIYACVRDGHKAEPKFLKGDCFITRSPVNDPGDIQRVRAIGKPPEDKVCFFRGLQNVVVLPAVPGTRSLASCLGGGDVDGDMFDIVGFDCDSNLLPTLHKPPAEYKSVGTYTLDHPATEDDVWSFVVEYIQSDVLGLLSERLLTIADQSEDGMSNPLCLELAKLCSQAVDYPKNGIAVETDRIPYPPTRFRPNWARAEVSDEREGDFYQSDRALGRLFENVELLPTNAASNARSDSTHQRSSDGTAVNIGDDPIHTTLTPFIRDVLSVMENTSDFYHHCTAPSTLFERYARELRYIRVTHSLTDSPTDILAEEEVVVGAILSNCANKRWRKDRTSGMNLHAGMIVKSIREEFIANPRGADGTNVRAALKAAWETYEWALIQRVQDGEGNPSAEGIDSFQWVVLGVVLDCLGELRPGLFAVHKEP